MSATLEPFFLVFVFDLGYDIDASSRLRFGFVTFRSVVHQNFRH